MSNISLVVLHVTIGKDSNGDGYGWYASVPQKVSKVPGVYEMLDITVDMQDKTIGVYALPNNVTEDQVKDNLVQSFTYTSSTDLPTQLLAAAQTAIKAYPADNYALKYSGHGSFGGIFADGAGNFLLTSGQFTYPNQVSTFLSGLNEASESQLAFLDFSTVCSTASAFNYYAMASYANYLVASNMERDDAYYTGGPKPDDGYAGFWTTTKGALDLEANLRGLLNAYQTLWSAWGGDGVMTQQPEQLSLFQLSAATPAAITMLNNLYNAGYSQVDVWWALNDYVGSNPSADNDAAEAELKATQIMKVNNNNQGGYKWSPALIESSNGLYYS